MTCMGMESITGLTEELIKGIGILIKCKGMECSLGLMGRSMMEGILMIRRKDGGCFHGLMERGMKGTGLTGFSMDKGPFIRGIR
eukprot:CAMPEP_0168314864 /NCGR_PEP_ID=MMETSP0210-20121227/9613_1 /TAXON_ID=40633 /ORGANISM="Condylostoma magnum, Strain COL2" /LENGTH=83 /DNA_ID=CAMNT_0008285339 /DNA_START=659 /DNA_END=910 /DNA_ORIENTATION=+